MNRFKEMRKAYGYKSQADLAKVLHVNQTAVSQWERGATTPSPPLLRKMSEMYDCSIEYLLGYSSVSDGLLGETTPNAPNSDTRQEMPIDALWNQLNPAGQAVLLDYADTLVSSGKYAVKMTQAAAFGGGLMEIPEEKAKELLKNMKEDDTEL